MPRIPIQMPQLGESIAEATILRFEVAAGEEVHADQDVLEVETQKATMSVTTPYAGRLLEWICDEGATYAVGATLGYLEMSEEEAAKAGVSEKPQATAETPPPDPEPAEDSTSHFAVDRAQSIQEGVSGGVAPTIQGLPVPVAATGAAYISPRLRARMNELGLNAADLAGIRGSGAGGRVSVEDFESFMRRLEEHRMTPASTMRIAVADSMRRSWTRPLATVGMSVCLDALLAHRKAHPAPKPGPTLYAIRALALALQDSTAVAGRLVGNRIVHPKAIDIGFAVEVDDGVQVPIISSVDQKKLSEMIAPYADLVEKARERRLPPESRGIGTATITNFGSFGIEWATPIPLPEQNLLLGMGAGVKTPVWDEEKNQFYPRTIAQLTLSFDHRVTDGGAAGRLLRRVVQLLENPMEL